MRFLHTSDWHLGQKFINQYRDQEQQMALDWLLQVIETERVDTLLVAGDVFDVGNPPVAAEEMYYRFLTRLKDTSCRHVVITGGNHDAPSRLNAPRGLLRALDMHVVGAATDPIEDEIIHLYDTNGQLEAVVVAVPFLRERDFKTTHLGETADERIARMQEGIARHYQQLADLLEPVPATPVVAMGHLYAKGASAHEEQHNIYLGNLENIGADQFSAQFHYVALGHIHRMQKVGKQERIRYCGSLIPLSFSEITDKKGVIIADVTPENGLSKIREVAAPVFRRLTTLKGTMTQVEEKLIQNHRPDDPLPAWLEIVVTGEPGIAAPDRRLRELAQDLHLEILKIKIERGAHTWTEAAPTEDLSYLSPEEVFEQRCIAKGLSPEETERMKAEFGDLKNWMQENW